MEIQIPQKFGSEKKVVHVAGGGSFTFALLEDGSLVACGKNTNGELGYGNYSHKRQPVQTCIPDEEISSFGCGFDFSWLVTKTGKLFMWGSAAGEKFGPCTRAVQSSYSMRTENIPKYYFHHFTWSLNLGEEIWQKVFYWLFLGVKDEESVLSLLPIEVLFQAVLLYK